MDEQECQELSHRYAGKLLLRNEIHLNHPLFQTLLNTSYFSPQSAIKKNYFHDQCQRCGNQKRSLFGHLPCYMCGKTHVYCRKCIDMGRVMTCKLLYEWTGPEPNWPRYPDACTWNGELTATQQKVADRVTQVIQASEKELLVWAVCGAGKTEMLFSGISEALKQGQRICLATPRSDVVLELLPRMREAFAAVSIQGLYGGSEDKDATAQFILATTHQLMRFKHAFDTIIIDEVDAFPYTHDPSLPFAAKRAVKPAGTTIYLTATPRQEHQAKIARKKLPHVFVPVRFHGHPLPVPEYRMCPSLKKDFEQGHPPNAFLKWYSRRKNTSRQLLLFVPSVRLAEALSESLSDMLQDHVVRSVHAADTDREQKVSQFRHRDFDILITTTILERGVTFPAVDVCVLAANHQVFDEAALVQIAGRAGRSPDDPTGEVIFFHDGKTEAMIKAIKLIKRMNRRGDFK
ncbi:DNA/RNA helicase [Lentibacillus cibarius]|uniref:DNA/RNA helicase n=2 Tax=Lentibacillus cibarius TaxID=2583219 RepID=A0A5S3QI16_9BACI|nr:DNA/RNA helicase [Lentibacillus cibarius]